MNQEIKPNLSLPYPFKLQPYPQGGWELIIERAGDLDLSTIILPASIKKISTPSNYINYSVKLPQSAIGLVEINFNHCDELYCLGTYNLTHIDLVRVNTLYINNQQKLKTLTGQWLQFIRGVQKGTIKLSRGKYAESDEGWIEKGVFYNNKYFNPKMSGMPIILN